MREYTSSVFFILGILAVSGHHSLAHAEDISFEAWEAGVVGDVYVEQLKLESIELDSIDNDELARAAIPNALQNVRVSEQRPAYLQRDEEDGFSQKSELQQRIQEKEDLTVDQTEVPLPPPTLFEQPVYYEPTGRVMESNLNTVERP